MKLFKRGVALLCMVVLLAGMAVGVYAQDSSVSCADYGLKSSHSRVEIFENTIGVYTHSFRADGSYPVSSATLLSALTADAGYTLSYTDVDKNPATSSSVFSGYIRVSGNGEDVYIPIVKKGKVLTEEFGYVSGSGWYLSNGAGADVSEKTSIGGKSSDDTAVVLAPKGSPLASFTRLEMTHTAALHTYVFNVYADGDSVARVNYRYSDTPFRLLSWGPDGVLWYEEQNTLVAGPTLQRGQWHTIALTYDQPRGRYLIYADGVRLTENGTPFYTDASKLLFGIDTGSSTGCVAYDDLDAYTGYYFEKEQYKKSYFNVSGEGISLNDNVIKIDPAYIADMDSFLATVSTDAVNAWMYADDKFSAEIDTLQNNSVLVVLNDETAVYSYYYIKLLSLEVEGVNFQREGDMVSAKATITYEGSQPRSATLVMVLKDADGRICGISSSATVEITDAITYIETPAIESGDMIAEAFLINDWNLREELSDKIYSEEE